MGMLGNVRECYGLLGNVRECQGMFRNDNVQIIFLKKRIVIEYRKVGM